MRHQNLGPVDKAVTAANKAVFDDIAEKPDPAAPAPVVRASQDVECTVIASTDPLTKSYTLGVDGNPAKSAEPFLTRGIGKRLRLAGTTPLGTLRRRLETITSFEALVCGAMTQPGDDIAIATHDNISRGAAGVSRDKDFAAFRPSGPALLFLDHDQKDLPPEVMTKLAAFGPDGAARLLQALASVFPALRRAGVLIRPSCSTGIRVKATGVVTPGGGLHGYFVATDGADIEDFIERLDAKLVLAGFGWTFVSDAGTPEVRSLIDVRASGRPSRLVFEGSALLEHSALEHVPGARRATVRNDGVLLDTKGLAPLTAAEELQLAALRRNLIAAARPRIDAARAAWVETQERRFLAEGMSAAEAKRRAARAREAADGGKLDIELYVHVDDRARSLPPLGDGSDGEHWVAVRTLLAHPARYHRRTGSDPLEPDYQVRDGGTGRNKAVWYVGVQGGARYARCYSQAHGRWQFEVFCTPAELIAAWQAREDMAEIAALWPYTRFDPATEAADREAIAAAGVPSWAGLDFALEALSEIPALVAAKDWDALCGLRASLRGGVRSAVDTAHAVDALGALDPATLGQRLDEQQRGCAPPADNDGGGTDDASDPAAAAPGATERTRGAAARMRWLRGETTAPLDHRPEVDAVMRELNRRYAVVMSDGAIMEEVFDTQLGRYRYNRFTFRRFQELHDNVLVQTGVTKVVGKTGKTTNGTGKASKSRAKSGKTKTAEGGETETVQTGEADETETETIQPVFARKGTLWTRHANRLDYRRVVFDPTGRHHPTDYNLWRGFGVKSRVGDWSLLRRHMQDVICAGVISHYEYLVRWIARMVQFPERLGEVAIVLRGVEGTGKGILGRTLANIVGTHGMQITSGIRLTSQFNHHLRGLVFLFADEATFAGDRSAWGHIKGLITEPTMAIERKGADVEVFPNFLHFLMASNEAWVVPADSGSRRWCVFDTVDQWPGLPEPERRVKEQKYFTPIYQQLDAGGREAMLHDLLAMDLTGFDVRAYPVTEALLTQREQSLPTPEAWWMAVLARGFVWESECGLDDHFGQWHPEVTTRVLYNAYRRFARGKVADHGRLLSPTAFGRFLVKMGGRPCRPRNAVIGERARSMVSTGELMRSARREHSYTFGDLAEARGRFTRAVMPVTWDEEGDTADDDEATTTSIDDVDSPF